MHALDVRTTVGPLDGRVTAVSAFEITHAVRVHDFLVRFELLRGGENRVAILAVERQVDVDEAVVISQVLLLAKRLVAAGDVALQAVLLGRVRQLMLAESVLSDGGVIAVGTLENRFRPDVDPMRRVEMIVQRILHVRPESAAFLRAIVPSGLAVLAAHVVLQAHRVFERHPAQTANMRNAFLFFLVLFRALFRPADQRRSRRRRRLAFAALLQPAPLLVTAAPVFEAKLLAASVAAEEKRSLDHRLKHVVEPVQMVAETLARDAEKAAQIADEGDVDPHVAVAVDEMRTHLVGIGLRHVIFAKGTVEPVSGPFTLDVGLDPTVFQR